MARERGEQKRSSRVSFADATEVYDGELGQGAHVVTLSTAESRVSSSESYTLQIDESECGSPLSSRKSWEAMQETASSRLVVPGGNRTMPFSQTHSDVAPAVSTTLSYNIATPSASNRTSFSTSFITSTGLSSWWSGGGDSVGFTPSIGELVGPTDTGALGPIRECSEGGGSCSVSQAAKAHREHLAEALSASASSTTPPTSTCKDPQAEPLPGAKENAAAGEVDAPEEEAGFAAALQYVLGHLWCSCGSSNRPTRWTGEAAPTVSLASATDAPAPGPPEHTPE